MYHDGPWIEVIQIQIKAGKPGEEAVWKNFTGRETVIENAGAVADGQAVSGTQKP